MQNLPCLKYLKSCPWAWKHKTLFVWNNDIFVTYDDVMNEKVIYIFVLYLGILKNGNMQVYFFPVQTLCIHDDQFIFHCIEMCMKFQIIYDITRTLINKIMWFVIRSTVRRKQFFPFILKKHSHVIVQLWSKNLLWIWVHVYFTL